MAEVNTVCVFLGSSNGTNPANSAATVAMAHDDGLMSIDNRAMLHSATTPAALLDAFAVDDRIATPKWDS